MLCLICPRLTWEFWWCLVLTCSDHLLPLIFTIRWFVLWCSLLRSRCHIVACKCIVSFLSGWVSCFRITPSVKYPSIFSLFEWFLLEFLQSLYVNLCISPTLCNWLFPVLHLAYSHAWHVLVFSSPVWPPLSPMCICVRILSAFFVTHHSLLSPWNGCMANFSQYYLLHAIVLLA